jgi:malonyl-CoA O-methyltransferase
MYSRLMKVNFNTKAGTYDRHSFIQKVMAKDMVKILSEGDLKVSRIFETGCGTGSYTELLIQEFPACKIIINDISENMLVKCRGKIKSIKTSDAKYIKGDFEKIDMNGPFDLITGNAVFQWFRNPEKNFSKIRENLGRSGNLGFSIFINGTFKELKEAFKKAYYELGRDYSDSTLKFNSRNKIIKSLESAGFKNIKVLNKKYTMYYKSPVEFLDSLKNIGASHFKTERNVEYKIMKRMLNNYTYVMRKGEKVFPVTYNVLFCVAGV